jgi:hypothetical protein
VGEYIEGYTNLLMTLLMSVAAFFFEKRYAVLAIQLVGILFTLGTAFFALQTLKILAKSPMGETFRIYAYVLFAIILLFYPLNYWSLLGMETGLLSLLLSAGVLCSMLYAEKLDSKYLWPMTACFGLAYLTRNDSLLFAALTYLYLTQTLKDRTRIPAFFASGLSYGLFGIGQTLFRWFYYGSIVPNTYTLKLVGMPLTERLANGWGFVQIFLKESWFVLLFAILVLLIKPSLKKFYLFGFFLISIIYQVYVGGDPWPYWRIMAPTMPFVFILFISAFSETQEKISVKLSPSTFHFLLLTFTIIGVYSVNSRFLPELALQEFPFNNKASHDHIDDAIAINALTDDSATVGVFWAGTLPYYVDRPAIDFLGKSDPYIANLSPDTSGQVAWDGMDSVPGHNKYDLNYSIKQLLPTYVQAFEWGGQNLNDWAAEHYVKVKYGNVRIYLLKDSPHVRWDEVGQ